MEERRIRVGEEERSCWNFPSFDPPSPASARRTRRGEKFVGMFYPGRPPSFHYGATSLLPWAIFFWPFRPSDGWCGFPVAVIEDRIFRTSCRKNCNNSNHAPAIREFWITAAVETEVPEGAAQADSVFKDSGTTARDFQTRPVNNPSLPLRDFCFTLSWK